LVLTVSQPSQKQFENPPNKLGGKQPTKPRNQPVVFHLAYKNTFHFQNQIDLMVLWIKNEFYKF